MQIYGEKSTYFGWFRGFLEGGHIKPPPYSGCIPDAPTCRVKLKNCFTPKFDLSKDDWHLKKQRGNLSDCENVDTLGRLKPMTSV